MFRIQFWTIWTYFWNFEKSQKKSVLRQAAQPILPTAGNVIEHTPQPGRHQRHREYRGESRNTRTTECRNRETEFWRLHLQPMNQSKSICEWANRCSHHKKIALIRPFSQSRQIDLSRDNELRSTVECVKCWLLQVFHKIKKSKTWKLRENMSNCRLSKSLW